MLRDRVAMLEERNRGGSHVCGVWTRERLPEPRPRFIAADYYIVAGTPQEPRWCDVRERAAASAEDLGVLYLGHPDQAKRVGVIVWREPGGVLSYRLD